MLILNLKSNLLAIAIPVTLQFLAVMNLTLNMLCNLASSQTPARDVLNEMMHSIGIKIFCVPDVPCISIYMVQSEHPVRNLPLCAISGH